MSTSAISIASLSQSQSSSAISSGLQAVLAVEYSIQAGGATYSANVQPVDGGYEASVSNLPGVSASGGSVQQVENDLGNLVNFFA
jgi:hypothetical protein